jgi:conjugal transfer pilus assembly protein TraF
MKLGTFIVITMLSTLSSQAIAWDAFNYPSPFQCDGESKWLWYCDEAPQKPEKPKTEPVKPQPIEKPKEIIISKPKAPEIEAYEQLQKNLQDALKIATMNPTEANVKRWVELNNEVGDRSSNFADVGKRVIWQNPELDYSQRFPTSDIAKTAQRSALQQKKSQVFSNLAEQGWGLFFFFKDSCPYCHKQAPVLQFVKQDTGLPILPVTMDGSSFDAANALGNVMVDQGQSTVMGVRQVPSLVLGNVNTKQLVFISSGIQSAEEIENRIYVLTSTKPGDNF